MFSACRAFEIPGFVGLSEIQVGMFPLILSVFKIVPSIIIPIQDC